MKVINQSYEILSLPWNLLQTLELAGRTCYKSEDKITPDSAAKFVSTLISRKHHAMFEFGTVIVKFITNRGVTHELVRHRLCSFAQESTRYVNYGGDDLVFIQPVWGSDQEIDLATGIWTKAMEAAEWSYKRLLSLGWRPEQAREVLPNSLKTEIVVQANIREWRHIFNLRTAPTAHPQMRTLLFPLLNELKSKLPVVFDDIRDESLPGANR